MGEYLYNNIEHYFLALKKVGHYKYKDVYKLLVLIFWYHILFEDYRGYIKRDDYRLIEKGLNCLYGTTCLIPYTRYLKMGNLKLGEMTEVLSRIEKVEDTVNAWSGGVTINNKVIKGKNNIATIKDLDLSDYDEIND